MTRELLQQALEKILTCWPESDPLVKEIRAWIANAELSQPEQKPHYVMRTCTDCDGAGMCRKWGYDDYTDGYCHSCRGTGRAIYAAGSDEPIPDWDIGERPIELANPEQSPAWHDAPTEPGLWLSSSSNAVRQLDEYDIHNLGKYNNSRRWYGPIPEDLP